jgi:transposase
MGIVQYVGMDVHKDFINLAVFSEDGQEPVFETRIQNNYQTVCKQFERLKTRGEVKSCYEAGCMGFELQRLLSGMGVTCYVIAPGKIPRRTGERVKTDPRDARKMGRLLRSGELEPIHVISPENEAVRDYIQAREDVRVDLSRNKQRLLNFLLRHDYLYENTYYWSKKHEAWLKSLKFQNLDLQATMDSYYYRIKELDGILMRMDERIEEISRREPYKALVDKLRCLKGIDYLTALACISAVEDFRRFPNAESFMSFLGLVPGEYSSGLKRVQGAITKSGNSHLRKLLIEASWHYCYYAPISKRLAAKRRGQSESVIAYADKAMHRLQKKFSRLIYKGKSSKKAVTAVARELSGFIWGLMVGNMS